MKKILNILIVSLVTFSLGGCSLGLKSNDSYIKEIISFELPPNTELVEVHDNREFVVIAKYQIEHGNVNDMLENDNFNKWEYTYPPIVLDNYLEVFNQIPDPLNGAYWRLANCKNSNSSDALVNQETGELWIQIRYPDWGGDGGCSS